MDCFAKKPDWGQFRCSIDGCADAALESVGSSNYWEGLVLLLMAMGWWSLLDCVCARTGDIGDGLLREKRLSRVSFIVRSCDCVAAAIKSVGSGVIAVVIVCCYCCCIVYVSRLTDLYEKCIESSIPALVCPVSPFD